MRECVRERVICVRETGGPTQAMDEGERDERRKKGPELRFRCRPSLRIHSLSCVRSQFSSLFSQLMLLANREGGGNEMRGQ